MTKFNEFRSCLSTWVGLLVVQHSDTAPMHRFVQNKPFLQRCIFSSLLIALVNLQTYPPRVHSSQVRLVALYRPMGFFIYYGTDIWISFCFARKSDPHRKLSKTSAGVITWQLDCCSQASGYFSWDGERCLVQKWIMQAWRLWSCVVEWHVIKIWVDWNYVHVAMLKTQVKYKCVLKMLYKWCKYTPVCKLTAPNWIGIFLFLLTRTLPTFWSRWIFTQVILFGDLFGFQPSSSPGSELIFSPETSLASWQRRRGTNTQIPTWSLSQCTRKSNNGGEYVASSHCCDYCGMWCGSCLQRRRRESECGATRTWYSTPKRTGGEQRSERCRGE